MKKLVLIFVTVLLSVTMLFAGDTVLVNLASTTGAYGMFLTSDGSGGFYGTTQLDGGSGCSGSVVHFTESGGVWSETKLVSFCGTGGGDPYGKVVVDGSGNLWGVTTAGGSGSEGILYKLTLSGGTWTESVRHNFAGGSSDGAAPHGIVIDGSGNIFGTTFSGGTGSGGFCGGQGCGVVFEYSSSGTYSILYNFQSTGDYEPDAAPILSSPNVPYYIYGTAQQGGANGYGSVWKLSNSSGSWTESTVYSFQGGLSDGCNPSGSLFLNSGTLYGVAACGSNTDGIIFSVTTGGTETVIHNQGSGAEVFVPLSDITIDGSGNLYGSMEIGGNNTNTDCIGGGSYMNGCGAVFKLVPVMGGGWTYSTLYKFNGPTTDGDFPWGAPIPVTVGGTTTLYGITYYGGSGSCTAFSTSVGCGTFYSIP